MATNIEPEVFNQPTVTVAKQLLGAELLYKNPKGWVGGIITETEAYTQNDPACHAFNGKKTKRNAPMFLNGGHIYIYFIYGMYHCLNIVSEPKGVGAAVLIRELEPTKGIEIIKQKKQKIKQFNKLLNGPSKLMMGLGIPENLNGTSLWEKKTFITLNYKLKPKKIECLPRVGISKGQDKL